MLKPEIVTAFRIFLLGICSPNVNKPSPVLILILTFTAVCSTLSIVSFKQMLIPRLCGAWGALAKQNTPKSSLEPGRSPTCVYCMHACLLSNMYVVCCACRFRTSSAAEPRGTGRCSPKPLLSLQEYAVKVPLIVFLMYSCGARADLSGPSLTLTTKSAWIRGFGNPNPCLGRRTPVWPG